MPFLSTPFGAALATFFISLVPVVELRGAIPFGIAHGLDPWLSMTLSVLGNMLPVPLIILFIRKIFTWLRKIHPKLDGFISGLETRAEKKMDKVRRYSFLGLFILVAIPLPGTGAWTGALVAAMLEMRLKDALPAIFLGVLTAGILVTLASMGIVHLIA